MIVKIKRLRSDAQMPVFATKHSAGADLFACLPDSDAYLDPGEWCLIPTGLAFEIEPGYEVQIRPRSGLALKYGITVLNAPGTIDEDYRGEVGVILHNVSKHTFIVRNGDRIAQAVVARVTNASGYAAQRFAPRDVFQEITTELSSTARGAGGFGSTGVGDNSSIQDYNSFKAGF